MPNNWRRPEEFAHSELPVLCRSQYEALIDKKVAEERERIRLELLGLVESEAEEVHGWTCNQIGECNLSEHRARLVDAEALCDFARRLEPKP